MSFKIKGRTGFVLFTRISNTLGTISSLNNDLTGWGFTTDGETGATISADPPGGPRIDVGMKFGLFVGATSDIEYKVVSIEVDRFSLLVKTEVTGGVQKTAAT